MAGASGRGSEKKKQSSLRSVLIVKLTEFANRLGVGCEGKTEIKNDLAVVPEGKVVTWGHGGGKDRRRCCSGERKEGPRGSDWSC